LHTNLIADVRPYFGYTEAAMYGRWIWGPPDRSAWQPFLRRKTVAHEPSGLWKQSRPRVSTGPALRNAT